MALGVYPDKYLLVNDENTKTIGVVVQIEGIDLLSNVPIFTRIRYGDPNLVYAPTPYVYGGLRRKEGSRDLLSFEGSSLTISQKIEPEQGRGAISLMTMAFIDKDGYLSKVISPGVLLDDILGKRARIYIGYQNTSFPEDYFTVFRGYVTGVTSAPGLVTLQFSDGNVKKRAETFTSAKSTLSAPINDSTLTIPITKTTNFHDQIMGPDGSFDSMIKTYIKIEDEIIEYGPGGLTPTQITATTRGARGTTPASHASGKDVSCSIDITGNPIEMMLKIMLSGWVGPYKEDVPVFSFVQTNATLGPIDNAVVLDLSIDAVEDLGLTVGDYITVSGSGAGNNGQKRIIDILPYDELPNRILLCDSNFNLEPPPTSAVLALRSQFDTFPITAGLKLDPIDVDTKTHITIQDNFLGQDVLSFFLQEEQNGKTFLESQIHLVEGTYPVTRYGKISITITKPPLADVKLPVLDKDSILDPNNIAISRMTNNRRFFDEIRYSYDKDDNGEFLSKTFFLDSDSASIIGLKSTLPIEADGVKTALGGALLVDNRSSFLLQRYKKAAFEIKIKTNWRVGSLIETGDTVLFKDEGNLQVTNFDTGERNLGVQMYEVIQRDWDLKSGNVTLSLLSNLGFNINDRFGTISPSSVVASGSTSSEIIIEDSYGQVFPLQEFKKWTDYLGQQIRVHSFDESVSGVTTLVSFDATNDHKMIVSPALSFTPSAGYIVDIIDYPTSTDPLEAQIYKLIHAFIDPSVPVVTGISNTQFTVGVGDSSKFQVGMPVLIHNVSYSILSPDVFVTDVTGVTITVSPSLGFTPAAGQFVELIGFADFDNKANGGPYRLI